MCVICDYTLIHHYYTSHPTQFRTVCGGEKELPLNQAV